MKRTTTPVHRLMSGPIGAPLPASPDRATPLPLDPAASALGSCEPPIRVVVVDDEPPLRRAIARILEVRGMEVSSCEDGAEALSMIGREGADVMLLDLALPGVDGMEVLRRARATCPDLEIVMMTAFGEVDTAVQAVKAGAYDFLTKPFSSPDAVALAVQKAAERRRLVDRARQLEAALDREVRGDEIICTTRKMHDVVRLVATVAQGVSTVLLHGESGTGKELIARTIHQAGPRAACPFVAVNCSAIPPALLDAELFGHVQHAFPGATTARDGLFAAADGGTLFLDEIGALPLATQVRLLRALQQAQIEPVGSTEARIVDVRVIAATQEDLAEGIAAGTFRDDLYYRLSVIELHVPPLRDRREDIPLLAAFFLRKLAHRLGRAAPTIDPAAMHLLCSASWPGNVRELENAIERALVLSHGDTLALEDFPRLAETPVAEGETGDGLFAPALTDLPYRDAKRVALRAFEKQYVTALLKRTSANVSQAARMAGLDRSNFRRIVRKCGR